MIIKVLKFGGTSQNNKAYEMIKNIIKREPETRFIIILSAISNVTNKLIEFVNTKNFSIWNEVIQMNIELAKTKENKFIVSMENKLWNLENDQIEIIAMGEFFTTNILNEYLNSKNIRSKFISSFDVIKSTQSNNNSFYNKGEYVVNEDIIFDTLEDNQVVIIPGFSGHSSDNKPCLLGRGGSDTTGSIIAASVDAIEYEIWTDVNGIYSSDPRKINNTFLIKNIGYNQAQEIAAMGAKVIHPFCILPCANKNIPIIIKNTFNELAESTVIDSNNKNDSIVITIQGNVTVFNITSANMWNNYGFVYDIFSIFKKYNIDVNIINTSQFNITTTTEDTHTDNLLKIKDELQTKYNIEIYKNNSIVSVVGNNICKYKNIGKLFEITQKYDIILTSYSSNDMTLSWVINENKSLQLANELHNLLII